MSIFMKRIFFVIFVFVALSLAVEKGSVLAVEFPLRDFGKKMAETIETNIKDENSFGTYSDSDFKTATNDFSSGQKVYVRLELKGSGEGRKIIRLLDGGKNEIDKVTPSQEGGNPYIYIAVFTAPAKEGVYYLDAKVEDGKGFSFAGQKNINVGKNASEPVSSRAESKVSISGKENSLSLTPSPTVVVSPAMAISPTAMPEKEEQPIEWSGFFSRMLEFFRKFLFGLTKQKE